MLGYSSRGDVAAEIARVRARKIRSGSTASGNRSGGYPRRPELHRFAVNAAGRCFGRSARSATAPAARGAGLGFPNLLDDDWLWGGTLDDIEVTVTYGIRNEDHADARWSVMPAFGADGLLEAEEIDQVVNYVLRMSAQAHDAALARQGPKCSRSTAPRATAKGARVIPSSAPRR
jgi:cytochrome c oxidase cbb3-type subunit III